MHIVVEMPSFIGDCVNATPSLEMIRKSYPDATITLFVRNYVKPLFNRDNNYNIVIDKTHEQGIKGALEFILWGRKNKIDIAILLKSKMASAILFRLAGARKVYGYHTEGRGIFLSNKYLKLERNHHYANRYAMVTNLACHNEHDALPLPVIRHDQSEILSSLPDKPKIAIYIGGEKKAYRRCPVETMAAVLTEIDSLYDACFVFLGDAQEESENSKLINLLPGKIDAHNLAGKTSLQEYIDVVSNADFLISIDSSAIHIAGAANVPMVVLLSHGKNLFSSVIPRVSNCKVVASRGAYIYPDDQMKTLYARPIIEECLQLFEGMGFVQR